MWFIGVKVEQETSAPLAKKNPGSTPALEEAFEFRWSSLADEKKKIDQKTHRIGQTYIWNPMITGIIM